jgi:hypothetical protein
MSVPGNSNFAMRSSKRVQAGLIQANKIDPTSLSVVSQHLPSSKQTGSRSAFSFVLDPRNRWFQSTYLSTGNNHTSLLLAQLRVREFVSRLQQGHAVVRGLLSVEIDDRRISRSTD